MITVEDSVTTCDTFGFGVEDYLRTWFSGVPGSILFVRRVVKPAGGYWFKATKGFASTEIAEAAEYIRNFDDPDSLYIKTSTFDVEKIDRRAKTEGFVVGNKDEVHTVVGVAMDVDAGKKDSYASQATVWQAIHSMPAAPTMIVLSGHADHGFHVYWKFADPIEMESATDVEQLNQRIRSWRDLLRDKIAALIEVKPEGFDCEKLVDRTYGVDRVLRPVGAVRTSGDPVKLILYKPSHLHTLTELTAPGWSAPIPAAPAWPRPEESVIDQYFASVERSGNPITIESLLVANKYLSMDNGNWIRKDAETGSRSLTEGDVINGLPGVNVFSGGCAPLKCGDDKNDTGRRYSLQQLWVAFTFGDTDDPANWERAAAFCYGKLKPDASEVFSEVQADESASEYPRIVNAEKLGNEVLPVAMRDIIKQLKDAYPGWPKVCQGRLFVIDCCGEAQMIDKPTEFFGWMNEHAQTVFHTGPSAITKAEFFERVPQYMERYKSIETYPHFPALPGAYYLHKSPGMGDGKTLNRFLDFFAPATPADRELILAFIVTTFWGGPRGARPLFGIDAMHGTGSGKSSLAFKVAALSGSCFQFDQSTNEDRLRSNLVSDTTGRRIAVLDNAKSSRISNSLLESMITTPEIAGHVLYHGYMTRDNHLTWVVTMNGMAMSRDLAQRSVKIVLDEPASRAMWNESIDQFIEVNRERIIADVAGFFERPQTKLSRNSRWSPWENAVLSRLANPDGLCDLIRERASEIDGDAETSASLIEYIQSQLSRRGYGINDVVHIPTNLMVLWAVEATGRDLTLSQLTGMLKMLVGSGSLVGLTPNPSRKRGRGWLYGPAGNGEVHYDIHSRDVRN